MYRPSVLISRSRRECPNSRWLRRVAILAGALMALICWGRTSVACPIINADGIWAAPTPASSRLVFVIQEVPVVERAIEPEVSGFVATRGNLLVGQGDIQSNAHLEGNVVFDVVFSDDAAAFAGYCAIIDRLWWQTGNYSPADAKLTWKCGSPASIAHNDKVYHRMRGRNPLLVSTSPRSFFEDRLIDVEQVGCAKCDDWGFHPDRRLSTKFCGVCGDACSLIRP